MSILKISFPKNTIRKPLGIDQNLKIALKKEITMDKGYLPLEHHHKLIKEHTPLMRWDGKEDFNA